MLKESFEPFSPHNTIEEMEVEMILLNLTDEILENARKEGQEVVEVEMSCYVTVGTFARRGLSSTAKTLRSLVWWFEVLSTKSKKRT